MSRKLVALLGAGLVFLLVVVGVIVYITSPQGQAVTEVDAILSDPDGMSGKTVKTEGVVVEMPVSSESGTIFSIAESPTSTEKLKVYYSETEFPARDSDGVTLPPEETLGMRVVATGEWNGTALNATDLLVAGRPRY